MAADEFFRARLQTMIDLRHPLAVLTTRLPWPAIETALAAKFAREDRPAKSETTEGLFGAGTVEFEGGVSAAGRPRLPIRLMAGLLYLKNSFNLRDEELVQRWAENVYYPHFAAGQEQEQALRAARAGGRVHLQGQGAPALRVRREGRHGRLRCPSNFVFQRAVPMPPWIAEQHVC